MTMWPMYVALLDGGMTDNCSDSNGGIASACVDSNDNVANVCSALDGDVTDVCDNLITDVKMTCAFSTVLKSCVSERCDWMCRM